MILITIDGIFEITLKACESMPNTYWYTLHKKNQYDKLLFKQRTAMNIDNIILEVNSLIKINS